MTPLNQYVCVRYSGTIYTVEVRRPGVGNSCRYTTDNMVTATKILRDATGLGLREAYAAVKDRRDLTRAKADDNNDDNFSIERY